jgi:hypothetical protein
MQLNIIALAGIKQYRAALLWTSDDRITSDRALDDLRPGGRGPRPKAAEAHPRSQDVGAACAPTEPITRDVERSFDAVALMSRPHARRAAAVPAGMQSGRVVTAEPPE